MKFTMKVIGVWLLAFAGIWVFGPHLLDVRNPSPYGVAVLATIATGYIALLMWAIEQE